MRILLVVFQAIATIIVCCILQISPNFNLRTAQKWAPVNILFCGKIFTGMASLQHTNSVPMIGVFNSFATIMTAAGGCIIYGAPVELLVKCDVCRSGHSGKK